MGVRLCELCPFANVGSAVLCQHLAVTSLEQPRVDCVLFFRCLMDVVGDFRDATISFFLICSVTCAKALVYSFVCLKDNNMQSCRAGTILHTLPSRFTQLTSA